MKKKKNIFYIKILILCFLIFIGIFILIKISQFVFFRYFSIQDIITFQKDIELSYLKGKNIFSINLKSIFDKLSEDYPQYRIKQIRIQLPNQLLIKSERRLPVAYVRLYRNFALDDEGVLFFDPESVAELPVIYGLETKLNYIKSGYRPRIKELHKALQLIHEFNRRDEFKKYKIKRINLENSFSLTFFIDGIEVRVSERIPESMGLLKAILFKLNGETQKISYIDLRFKEPIIKYEK
ncbi:MAG: cell division protein FtsQ [Candidatus Omnitrophica bacterium]|nr:cell division protein FtsQ [Candidatus Omnitrophota bacterium]